MKIGEHVITSCDTTSSSWGLWVRAVPRWFPGESFLLVGESLGDRCPSGAAAQLQKGKTNNCYLSRDK